MRSSIGDWAPGSGEDDWFGAKDLIEQTYHPDSLGSGGYLASQEEILADTGAALKRKEGLRWNE